MATDYSGIFGEAPKGSDCSRCMATAFAKEDGAGINLQASMPEAFSLTSSAVPIKKAYQIERNSLHLGKIRTVAQVRTGITAGTDNLPTYQIKPANMRLQASVVVSYLQQDNPDIEIRYSERLEDNDLIQKTDKPLWVLQRDSSGNFTLKRAF